VEVALGRTWRCSSWLERMVWMEGREGGRKEGAKTGINEGRKEGRHVIPTGWRSE